MKYFTTPKGPCGYSSLVKPDTKFDPEGKYKTSITLPEEQAQPLIDMFKEEAVDELGPKKAAKAKMPVKENDDGTVTLTFKTKNKPKLFDAKGNPIKNTADLRVGSGSTIRVKGAAKAYENGANIGVTLYLNEVQIIKLVEFGGGGWEAEDDEDAYVADNSAPSVADDSFAGDPPADADEEDVDF